jgi:succinate-semialdehyde dehydrogenase/glutarate-semialdehyde dehydrogenase
MQELVSINPANGATIRSYGRHTGRQIDEILDASERAYASWSTLGFAERGEHLCAVAAVLRQRAEDLARLMAQEMGKPLPQGEAEAEKCAWVCEHYAEHARAFLEPEAVASDAARSHVHFRPIGPVLGVMPWNFPFWQVFRYAAPTLMAGNVAVLRHASNVTACALQIEEVFRSAGAPADVLRLILADKDQVAAVIEDPRIKAVTLTGSVAAGKAVASAAGRVVKKTVLELGGSDPYVILDDADLELAVEKCVTSRLINSGQSCIAAKRFVVVEPVLDAFTDAFVEAMRGKRYGPPLEQRDVDLGPMAQRKSRDRLHGQVTASIDAGARCLLGGSLPQMREPAAFYPPTVLSGVGPGMPAYDSEVFGPVAAIIPARDADDAIRIANDSAYGLGAAVFTRDAARGEDIAARLIHAGSCFVNDFVRSDPRLPFGGVKQSGYGRELGTFGIKEFVNAKTVYVARA